MQIDIVTLFPNIIEPYINESILKRAQQADLLSIGLHNPREHTTDKHRVTDEPPFGGGGGMVLKPDPIFRAVESIVGENDPQSPTPVILLTPQGRVFDQTVAAELYAHKRIVMICGRYEGFDERIRQHLITDEISIGDYVLTGGELGAMVIADAVARLIPGVLGADNAAAMDSHATGLLEGPHYTKPVDYRGWVVPDILRSGNTQKIDRWRREQSLKRTWERRPEMLLSAELSPADKTYLMILALKQAK